MLVRLLLVIIIYISLLYVHELVLVYLSEFARRWPLKMQGACRQGLLFQAAQGQF